MTEIRGGMGGQQALSTAAQAYTPSRTPDNLDSVQYAEVIDLLCEGEIECFPNAKAYTRGTDAYNIALLKDIYLDDTPILTAGANPAAPQASDYNFRDVDVYTRYGTQDQTFIPLSRTIQSEYSVGVKVEAATPVTRTINTAGVNGVRITLSTPQLQEFFDNGDIYGVAVDFAVEVSYNGGPFTRVIFDSFNGRTTDLYQREVRVNFTGSRGGSIVGVAYGQQDTGRWYMKGSALCVAFDKWTKGEAKCGRISQQGGWYVAQGNGGDVLKFRRTDLAQN